MTPSDEQIAEWREEASGGPGLHHSRIIALADALAEARREPSYVVSGGKTAAFIGHITDERDAAEAKLDRVRELHQPIRVYDECDHGPECPYGPVEVYDYMGCTGSFIGWACTVCCYDDEHPREDCPHRDTVHHGVPRDQACPTTAVLDGEGGEDRG